MKMQEMNHGDSETLFLLLLLAPLDVWYVTMVILVNVLSGQDSLLIGLPQSSMQMVGM
jgi:hypothetical protein